MIESTLVYTQTSRTRLRFRATTGLTGRELLAWLRDGRAYLGTAADFPPAILSRDDGRILARVEVTSSESTPLTWSLVPPT